MYKTKLQELCQTRLWSLPKYSATKQGLDHNPSFSATVVVNNQSFHTLAFSKSSREAQNEAAQLAFDHFSLPNPNPNPNSKPPIPIPPSSSFPQPSLISPLPGYPSTQKERSVAITETGGIYGNRQTLQQQNQETHQPLQPGHNTSIIQGDNTFKDAQCLNKSELLIYAQKRNLALPVYSCEREGPPHASRFKCRVTIDGKTYQSSEYFSTLKEAEHAAAKVALISLSLDSVQKDDSTFYKNLLQQLVQKEGLNLPAYYTNRSGETHSAVFISTVEIEGEHFTGEEAKTKKQAEMNAAKIAYNALKERRSSQIPLILPSSHQGLEASKLLSSHVQSNTFASLQHHVRPNAPMQQAKDRTGDGGSSLSEIMSNACPSSPCESRSVSFSASPSNCSTNLAANWSFEPSLNRVSLAYKKITVYPADKPIPDGSTLLPMRDDNWVAFSPPEATT